MNTHVAFSFPIVDHNDEVLVVHDGIRVAVIQMEFVQNFKVINGMARAIVPRNVAAQLGWATYTNQPAWSY